MVLSRTVTQTEVRQDGATLTENHRKGRTNAARLYLLTKQNGPNRAGVFSFYTGSEHYAQQPLIRGRVSDKHKQQTRQCSTQMRVVVNSAALLACRPPGIG